MKILVIPDVQVKEGVDTEHLSYIGEYIVDKKPDVIVCLGDFADMPSLSSYDVGKKDYEGRRYMKDVAHTIGAMNKLLLPLYINSELNIKNKKKQYKPRMIMCLGNHENRINKAINNDPKLDGLISIDDLQYGEFGWEVYDFLQPVIVEGVVFSHYFVTGLAGRPFATASAQLSKKHMSCIAGHQQGLQIATAIRADGAMLTSVIAGSCYSHEEEYLGKQGNSHWRGVLVLHDVNDGEFDLMPVSLKYLENKYKKGM